MKAVAWVVICASIAQFSVARGAVPASKPADADDAALPAYTPARIADLVKSKAATPHGAGFANQGMG